MRLRLAEEWVRCCAPHATPLLPEAAPEGAASRALFQIRTTVETKPTIQLSLLYNNRLWQRIASIGTEKLPIISLFEYGFQNACLNA